MLIPCYPCPMVSGEYSAWAMATLASSAAAAAWATSSASIRPRPCRRGVTNEKVRHVLAAPAGVDEAPAQVARRGIPMILHETRGKIGKLEGVVEVD